jgi:hypothetical protein
MNTTVRSPLSTGTAMAVAATVGAAVVALPLPAPSLAPVFAEVRLAADPVPLGGLVTSFLGNQLTYCSIICPDVVKLAVTVPAGALGAPAAFLGDLLSGNPLKAIGAAIASMTNPLDAAFDPIITNDLNLVLPRAQNALEVAVVGLLNIVVAGPAGFLHAVEAARQNTFNALHDTIPPTMTSPNPHGLVQVFAVEAINVASAIAFQAFEEGLLGIVQTADAAATTLARTGNLAAAFAAGESAAFESFSKALGYIATAAHNAAVNIGAAMNVPKFTPPGITSMPGTAAAMAVNLSVPSSASTGPVSTHAAANSRNMIQGNGSGSSTAGQTTVNRSAREAVAGVLWHPGDDNRGAGAHTVNAGMGTIAKPGVDDHHNNRHGAGAGFNQSHRHAHAG